MSNGKYSKLHTRTFTAPGSREWHSLTLNLQALSASLDKLNEEQPAKGSPEMAQWEEARRELRKLIVDVHTQQIIILQSCYK